MNQLIIEEDKNPAQFAFYHIQHMVKMIERNQLEKVGPYEVISFSLKDKDLIVGGVTGWRNLDFAYIEAVWIDEKISRQGNAKKLISHFEDSLASKKISCVLTSSHSASDSTLFWKACGYNLVYQTPISENSVSIFYFYKKL